MADVPTFDCKSVSGGIEITTSSLTLRYLSDEKPFNAANLSISLVVNGKTLNWIPGLANEGNLRGTRRTLDQCADTASIPEGLLSKDGWSLFDDSGSVVWDLEQTWVESRSDEHIYDWYFFGYGHDYKTLLKDYIGFGGDIPLVPRYVLGTWWSRFWAYHADDLVQLVKDFQSHEIPLDVLVVDMDWHTRDGWTGYTWNRELFPDPEAFLAWVHSQNLYVTFNLHPAEGVKKHESVYTKFAQLLGRDATTGEGIQFDATDKNFIQYYFELLHHPMEEQGVDFWWLDWQQGTDTSIKNLDPLPWLNHLHFRDSTRRNIRPMLYSRWGGLGNHRYPIGFSGDAYTTWESLAFQPYFTATAANVGYGWWSHDIGGHFGAADPELYARWVQFGAVSPCLRLHSTKDPLAERRPWAFPQSTYEAAKAVIQLRYKLFPYLYSAARANSQIGLSLCYPIYYEYSEVEDAYLAREQYFFGDQLIVAPIVSPADPSTGLASIDVWMPEGEWFDFTTLETYTGPRWVKIFGDLNYIPIFAKAGAILPLSPSIASTKEFDGSRYILHVFPGSKGQFEIYEDDGATEAYQHGAFETTLLTLTSSEANVISFTIGGSQGTCSGLPETRSFEIHFRGFTEPRAITINQNESTDWMYNAGCSEFVLLAENISRTTPLEIEISLTQQSIEQNANSSSNMLADVTKLLQLESPVTSKEQALDVALTNPSAENLGAIACLGGPFVHFVEYTTFEDAHQQLGTVVIIPPSDQSTYDTEIVWSLQKAGQSAVKDRNVLKNCESEQIIHNPFCDQGDYSTFRWDVSVKLVWREHTIVFNHQSRDAYPSLTSWQSIIYNPQTLPHSIQDVLSDDRKLNQNFEWETHRQALNYTVNIKQPYGIVLLKQERQRITNGEPLEACVTTSLSSVTVQKTTLYVQSIGDATCYLNGEELKTVEPITHATLNPMFDSWMPPKHTYYALPLQEGENQIIIFTRPDISINWWGVGATVFDENGKVLVQ
ncbi:MAG: DUF5110 domain-containing protein [Anaerolineae bacterium]|nr:DUF5110 domain-containing protein [Anaerolineae bacterium]